ncbi:MAG: hypothetical protein IJY56_03860 [Clostridia bacterium]|nr:hypothetical protein [Clostridia bacterium]
MIKGRKLINIFIISFLFILLAPTLQVLAVDDSTNEAVTEKTDADSLEEYLPENAAEKLEDVGVSSESPLSVLNISEEGIISIVIDAFNESFTAPVGVLISLFVLIIFCSVYETALITLNNNNHVYTYLCSAIICCILVVPLSKTMYRAGETVTLVGYFINGFVPVYCSALIMCGKTATAAAYGNGTILVSEVVTTVSYKIITPACGMVLALNVAGSVSSSQEGITRFSESISKSVKWLLGVVMTIFSSVMNFRTIAGAASDSFLTKTGRYIISTSIPVVGGSVAEAYNSIKTSASLIGTGIGLYGVIAVCIIMLPIFTELILYRIVMSISAIAADLFGLSGISRLLKSAGETVSVMSSVMVCVFISFVVSLAAVYLAGGIGK